MFTARLLHIGQNFPGSGDVGMVHPECFEFQAEGCLCVGECRSEITFFYKCFSSVLVNLPGA